jgi:hypothetical protein
MSLTSYRAAPPRVKSKTRRKVKLDEFLGRVASKAVTYEWVFQSVLRRLQGLAASYSSIA